jgi:hypothetical protein
VLTWRRAVDWTIAAVVLALLIFVPWLREHRSAIFTVYLAALAVHVSIKVIRHRYAPEREAAIKMMAFSGASTAVLFLISVAMIAALSVWPR